MAIILGNPIMLGGGGGSQSDLKKISTLTEGDTIKIKENGVLTDYYLAQQNYQPDLNGSGRVLFARKEAYGRHAWNSSANSTYANSSVDNFLNNDFKALFDADVRAAMGETSIPSAIGYGNSTVTTLQKSVFLLSVTEFGKSHANASVEGAAVPIADILTVANSGGVASAQWTRTPYNGGTGDVWYLSNSGNLSAYAVATTTYTIRPCFTLPNTATVNPEPNVDGSYTLQLENVNLTLNSLMAGDTVRVKEKGVFQDYYVAQHDYQPDLNGNGRTLFVRKEVYSARAWDTAGGRNYAESSIDTWLNREFKGIFDTGVREAMGETFFPVANSSLIVANIPRSVFLLSMAELGLSNSGGTVEGTALPIADNLKIAYYNGTATTQYLRSPHINAGVFFIMANGVLEANVSTNQQGIRPCFTLPASFSIEQNSEGTYDLVYESDYPMGYLELTIEGGTTQPTNPKENTIWVNTDVDLGLTYLAPNAPTNPQVGDVWVNTTNKYNSNGTNASTNLIRVNDNPYLEINVINISQWDGSAWVTRENSAIYANGAWTSMALWIYNYGTKNADYPIKYAMGSAQSSPLMSSCLRTLQEDRYGMYFTSNGTAQLGAFMVAVPVDFSKYNKYKIGVSAYAGHQYAYIYGGATTDPDPKMEQNMFNKGYGLFSKNNLTAGEWMELEFDVTSWTGLLYPGVAGNGGSSSSVLSFYINYWCFTA